MPYAKGQARSSIWGHLWRMCSRTQPRDSLILQRFSVAVETLQKIHTHRAKFTLLRVLFQQNALSVGPFPISKGPQRGSNWPRILGSPAPCQLPPVLRTQLFPGHSKQQPSQVRGLLLLAPWGNSKPTRFSATGCAVTVATGLDVDWADAGIWRFRDKDWGGADILTGWEIPPLDLAPSCGDEHPESGFCKT